MTRKSRRTFFATILAVLGIGTSKAITAVPHMTVRVTGRKCPMRAMVGGQLIQGIREIHGLRELGFVIKFGANSVIVTQPGTDVQILADRIVRHSPKRFSDGESTPYFGGVPAPPAQSIIADNIFS